MTTRHTSEPSKLVIAGNSYHVNAGTIRTLVAQRDELLAALRELQSAAQAAWNKGWEHDTLARNRLAEQIHRARAAIAKATEVQS